MPTSKGACDELADLLAENIVHYTANNTDLTLGVVSGEWGHVTTLAEVAGWIERNSVLDRGWSTKNKRMKRTEAPPARPLRERWGTLPFPSEM